MKTVLRLSATAALLSLISACSADPTATEPALGRIELSHATRVVTVHEQMSVHVVAFDASNGRLPKPRLEWTSDDPAIATVHSNGLITGHRIGRVVIRATGGGVQGSIEITVRAATIRVALQAGSPDLRIGETAVLAGQFLDADGQTVPGDETIHWNTSEPGVVRVQPSAGNPGQVEVTALSTGLARISGLSEGVEGVFIIAVVSEPEPNSPIQVADFHIVQTFDIWESLKLVPSIRVAVTQGRSVELVRIDVAVTTRQPAYPSLCANTRLPTGIHDLLGANSYPPTADLSLRFYELPLIPHGAALLTYREGGALKTVALRETENAWDYDFVFGAPVPWESCKT